jgi:hypothetical protein
MFEFDLSYTVLEVVSKKPQRLHKRGIAATKVTSEYGPLVAK